MSIEQINYLRFCVAEYVYYAFLGGTRGDDTPSEIRASAFRIIRRDISRGGSLNDALRHIDNMKISAALA